MKLGSFEGDILHISFSAGGTAVIRSASGKASTIQIRWEVLLCRFQEVRAGQSSGASVEVREPVGRAGLHHPDRSVRRLKSFASGGRCDERTASAHTRKVRSDSGKRSNNDGRRDRRA